jgi:hypothetical protein
MSTIRSRSCAGLTGSELTGISRHSTSIVSTPLRHLPNTRPLSIASIRLFPCLGTLVDNACQFVALVTLNLWRCHHAFRTYLCWSKRRVLGSMVYRDDTVFWVERDVGKRICAIIERAWRNGEPALEPSLCGGRRHSSCSVGSIRSLRGNCSRKGALSLSSLARRHCPNGEISARRASLSLRLGRAFSSVLFSRSSDRPSQSIGD